jgi:chromatin structure-remodeling complex subunit RSC9
MQAFSKTLPEIVVQTRDAGILHNLLPILIVAFQIPTIQPPPPSLIPHLLKTLTLSPPQPLLEYSVDLLISLTQNSANTRAILADRDFPAHLRNMVRLLERGAKKTSATWEAPGQIYGMIIPNPASIGGQLEQAAKKRKVDRENAQKLLQSGNTAGVVVEVGDRPPFMSVAAKRKLLAMPEPDRAIHW